MVQQLIMLQILTVALASGRILTPSGFQPDSHEMVNFINSIGTTWKAGKNFADGFTMEQMKGLGGVLEDSKHYRLPAKDVMSIADIDLPKQFDAREHWPKCPSIGEIHDQGNCGSCWAISVVEAISDRVCIATAGRLTADISTEDLLGCCREECGHGCNGGRPPPAWKYWVREGLVTGGLYNGTGCEPYSIAPCEHDVPGPRRQCGDPRDPTPECRRKCVDSYGKSYDEDKVHGKRAYSLTTVEAIMADIYRFGPVQADFNMMSDFASYKSGVYQSHSTHILTRHGIKIIGWGEEEGTPYWLTANSWNTDWGDKGFFKIKRGSNECNIEAGIHAGEPDV